MLARLSLAIVISIALGAAQAARASPITYDFAGTFNRPINGSREFSGPSRSTAIRHYSGLGG